MQQHQPLRPGEPGYARQYLPEYNQSSGLDSHAGAYQDMQQRSDSAERARQIAKALGWFSVGLGVAQLLAPQRMSRTIGIADRPNLMRAVGMREIASGVGILSQRKPTNWLWSRVAGDAMDLAMLGTAARSMRSDRRRLAWATAALAGVAVLDLLSSIDNTQRERQVEGASAGGAAEVEKVVTINRSPEECYRFWHDFESFPRFMKHLESVQVTGENRTHWKAKGPMGMSAEWNAEVTADEPNRYLAWRSVEGADVDNAGEVRFEPAPGGRGTIVRVKMRYSPPGGKAGAIMAKLFGEEPSRQIDEDLRRFKWLIETGEIPTTVGQPSGPRGTMNRLLFRKGAPG